MRKGTVVLVIMTAVCLLFLGAPGWAASPQYLGESTWDFTLTQNEDGPQSGTFLMKGSITRMGGKYYTMQGYLNISDPLIMAGGGVLIGETLYLTLSSAQQHTDEPWRDTGIMHMQLDKTTLNGTFFVVASDFDTSTIGNSSPFFDDRFTAGTISRTGPSIVLTPSLVGPSLLLLKDE